MSEYLRLFEDAICRGQATTGSATCEFCNKEHYAVGDESMPFGSFKGRQYVWGCQCPEIKQTERWIWAHRDLFLEYFKERGEAMRKEGARVRDDACAVSVEE